MMSQLMQVVDIQLQELSEELELIYTFFLQLWYSSK